MTKPKKPQKFTMEFEPLTIEHLGLRLYSTLPPVISELVSNAWDAESPKVEIQLPDGEITEKSEVVIRDFGHGMDATEIQAEFLPIGRNRRGLKSDVVMSKHGKVRVTGRKGLGKLSAFGVATEMEVRAVKGRQSICLRLNYDEIKKWPASHPSSPFEPEVVDGRTGATRDPEGVEIRLRGLHRIRPISADVVKKGLAQRLRFIGAGFEVRVNGEKIKAADRLERSRCPAGYSWGIKDIPSAGKLPDGRHVSGWIGFLEASSQAGRGVDIFANRKAVELESFFNYPSTHGQFARAHLVGEIHADFLDEKDDLATTARNSVVWESEAGQALQTWGQDALRWAFERWLEARQKEKETEVVQGAGFDKWLETRPAREQLVARRMVALLVKDENIEPESTPPLLEIIKGSVETVAFRELIEAIESEGTNPSTLLKLFSEWRVIEAREHFNLADGRLAAIGQLDRFIKEGALEVKEMQPLLEQNLWLVDPSWTEADGQTTYTKLLREKCKEPKDYDKEERRMDILGVRDGGRLTVLELKRPEKTLSRRDLEQIERYVDWARSQLSGTGPDSPKYIDGLLVVGKLSKDTAIAKKMERLSGDDIRVQTYRDMYHRSNVYFGDAKRILKKVAPEYSRRSSPAKKGRK